LAQLFGADVNIPTDHDHAVSCSYLDIVNLYFIVNCCLMLTASVRK